MKKLVAVIMFLATIISFSSCKSEIYQKNDVSSTELTKSAKQTTNINIVENAFETKTSDEVDENEGYGGGEITLQKYRSIYYSIPAPFWDIIDEDERNDIYGNYWETPDSETNIMHMRIFVEEFNIPKEEFDAANAEWARIVKEKLYGTPIIDPQDYANQEFDEVYNSDIIYTFDNDIINEYYLSHDYPFCYESEYEKALEDGIYETQTREIIDLADLEDELVLYNELKFEKENNTAENAIEEQISSDVFEPEATEITE